MARPDAIPENGFRPGDMPLDAARSAFGWLVTGPDPLSLDCRSIRGLPKRRIPLDELRDRLLDRRCPQPVRDAAWVALVGLSRAEGGRATIGCVGMALPALTPVAAELTARFAGDPRDVHAAVLTGFLGGLASVDLDRPRVMVRLRWAAYRGGHACLREALQAPTPSVRAFHSAPPPPPAGHPDIVLARAVAEAVISSAEAELIGSTRIGDTTLAAAASAQDLSYEAGKKARQRAERRLVAYLLDRATESGQPHDGPDPAAEAIDNLTFADPITERPPRAGRSRSVSDDGSGSGPRRRRRRTRRVSPGSPQTGVQGCGRTRDGSSRAVRPDRRDAEQGPNPEVPRCA